MGKPRFRTPAELATATADEVSRERAAIFGRMDYLMRGADGELMPASEQREYDALEGLMNSLGELPQMTAVDRSVLAGVVGGHEQARGAQMLLRPGQAFADSSVVRASGRREFEAEGSGEPVRFGALIRNYVTGRTDHMSDSELRSLRNAQGVGTGAGGGYLIPTPVAARFVDAVRNKTRVIEAGATTVAMTKTTETVPSLSGSSAPAWRAENTAVASGDLTFGVQQLNAKSLAFIVKASREVIEDATDPDLVRIIEDDLSAQVGIELDRVALRGTGTSPEPRGVRNAAGVTLTSLGVNGASPTWDHLAAAAQVVRGGNFDPSAYIAHSRSFNTLGLLKDTTGQYLRPPSAIEALPRLDTSQVPANLTVGTSTDCSEVYTGDWRHLYIGIRTGPMLISLVERYADLGQVGILVWLRADVLVTQPGAFVVNTGVRP